MAILKSTSANPEVSTRLMEKSIHFISSSFYIYHPNLQKSVGDVIHRAKYPRIASGDGTACKDRQAGTIALRCLSQGHNKMTH